MPAIEAICTATAKGQTTVPKTVRQALGVGYGGRIAFRVEDGAVTVRAILDTRGGAAESDPALAPFLDLLVRDIAARPEAIMALAPALAARLAALTEGVAADPDAAIEGDVAL